jgi:hypothetical protein
MNRLKELTKNLPKSKVAIENLINSIASNKKVIDDEGLSILIKKLNTRIDNEVKKGCEIYFS